MAGEKEVAVEGCTVQVQAPASGNVSITNTPYDKAKGGGNKAYREKISVSISGAVLGTCGGASGSGDINATATKGKIDGGKAVVRKDDQASITCNGTLTVPPYSACSFSATVKVVNAGQTKAKAK